MPNSYYLGPRRPRIRLDTWDEVVSAAGSGSLDETHWVELKQAVPATGVPANLELARDLASLSVDGGLLVIGIADARGRAGDVVGTEASGIQSRIAQVAAARVHPPLSVIIDTIPKPDEPETAVVVVTVPASADAPHMVDNRYWGRTDEGKRSLADVEVRRLLTERTERTADFRSRLGAVKDTLDGGEGRASPLGRLYMLIEPTMPASEPVSDLTSDKIFLALALDALDFASPGFRALNYDQHHPAGRLGSTVPFADIDRAGNEYMAVLLGDDGSVSMSAPAVRRPGGKLGSPGVTNATQILGTIHGSFSLARHIADRYTGYTGAYNVGVHITGLRGTLPIEASNFDYDDTRFHAYPADYYLATDKTTAQELREDTPSVVGRLTRSLLRTLQVEPRYLPYSHPSELAKRN